MRSRKRRIKRKTMILDFKEEKVMEENKIENIIDIIKGMDIKNLIYPKKRIDKDHRTTLINFGQSKYFIINFTMAKLMEIEQTDRNKFALYLFNII